MRARARDARSPAARRQRRDAVESRIREYRAAGGTGRIWIAVEKSLYSMDGDRELLAMLAERSGMRRSRHRRARATGVFGLDGLRLAAELEGRDNIIVLHTCGSSPRRRRWSPHRACSSTSRSTARAPSFLQLPRRHRWRYRGGVTAHLARGT
ncbi:MAG: hypothetical protein U1F35_05575 [Steroidobacteraceae bacterium]